MCSILIHVENLIYGILENIRKNTEGTSQCSGY